jgi:chromosome segregation ATPase
VQAQLDTTLAEKEEMGHQLSDFRKEVDQYRHDYEEIQELHRQLNQELTTMEDRCMDSLHKHGRIGNPLEKGLIRELLLVMSF